MRTSSPDWTHPGNWGTGQRFAPPQTRTAKVKDDGYVDVRRKIATTMFSAEPEADDPLRELRPTLGYRVYLS